MYKIFLKLFLLFLLSHHFLYGDGENIQISIANPATVQENSAAALFTISLSEEADWCNEVVVNYTTADASAQSGNDYSTTSSSLTFYGECDAPSRTASSMSQTVSIPILDDTTYEPSEYFFVNITNNTTGYEISDASAYVYINDDDTQPLELLSFADKGVTETDSDQIVSMVANFNQNVPMALTLTYHTENNTALAGTDYVASSGTINVPANSNNAVIPITVKGDITPEILKDFRVVIDTISAGTLTDSEAYIYINDDDGIQVDVSSSDVTEGNTGDSNSMEFKIFLTKDYPSTTPLTINYTTQDGSSPSATAGSDYITTISSVTFNQGDREKIIHVPIIGDDIIEPDENVKMVISGSSYIIDFDSEAEIINDDGSYPGVDFSTNDFSIVEGNSSTKILNFNFTLDADALTGTSFDYYTEDDDALVSDNDYVAINTTTYNIPAGTRNITIPVTINGDTKIENDETFYLKFQNEQNVVIHGHTAKGNIINDDGTYPKLSFDLASYSVVEGDNGQKDLNFTLQLDQAAIAGSSFDYETQDGSALSTDNDYKKINTKTHTFVGGERTLTIAVKITGDENIEANEEFTLKIFNASSDLKLTSDTISSKGIILNDDNSPSAITNVGEFRFDDCGNDEWKIDHSNIKNHALSASPTVIQNDGKSYMCSSLNGLTGTVNIPHHSAYEVDNGTISMLLYDHHNIWSSNSWMFQKGAFTVEVVRVSANANQGSLKVSLDGNVIDTQEVFFTNSDGGDLDTQWIHVAITFGTEGMKLYINGLEKGSHAYTGGIKSINEDFSMATLSGYYDEFYIFEGQMNALQIASLYQNTTNDKNIDGTSRDCGCYVDSDPFTCDNAMYISSSTNRNTGVTGKMWLHKVDTTQNPFNFDVMEEIGATELYNATAYNPDDNYIYGLYHKELVQLSRGANVTHLGTVNGLPSRFASKQLYAGAIGGGYYYVTGRKSKQNTLYKIKLSDKSVTEITLSEEVAIQDFSFYKNVNDAIPDNTFLYGVDTDGKLIKIDVRDGTITQIGSDHLGYEFDSSFSDMNGRFFANDSKGNGFFEFNIATGGKNFVSSSQPATFNDGANCVNAELVFNDYGDAPMSYGVPKHNITNGIFMGDNIDHDIHTFDTTAANGDDLDGVDDEDGVTLADGSDLNGTFLALGTIHNLKVKVSKAGYLNTWIDYNIDGDFDDVGEKIVTALYLTAGTHTISVSIPNGVTSNTDTYLRFRYSSTSNLNATEAANDGEVEDYMVQFGSDVLKGTFNIERTNSGTETIGTEARNAWYTQIAGRDFDYSIVFYDEGMTTEQEVSNVTVNIELYNEETNATLYQYKFHILDTVSTSRIDISTPLNDLANLPATKRTRFRISYGVDANGGIVQADCLSNAALCTQSRTDDAHDNFAIRPENFYIAIADNAILRKENTNALNNPLRVAAGYDYNLTVLASQHNLATISTNGYDASIDKVLTFNTSGTCADSSNKVKNISFSNGKYNNLHFTHNNVGNYSMKLQDTTWTAVDADKTVPDCLLNQSATSTTGNMLSGCNIDPISDLNLSFYPHHFNVNFSLNNLPNSGHDDFIYMSDLTLTDHNVSVQLLGSITAQSENNITTTNFTEGCAAEATKVNTNASTTWEDGNSLPIQTFNHPNRSRTDVNIARMIRYNNEPIANAVFDYVNDVANPAIDITKEKFKDDNNGTLELELRYNIQKHLSLAINPVQIAFHSIDVESLAANSTAEGLLAPNYFPIGSQNLNNTIRNFYFSKVSPDKQSYPRAYFHANPHISTPLNVDIFCNAPSAYCEQTGIINNTDTTGLSRVDAGWYISLNHNSNKDGIVQTLTPNRPIASVNPDNNISFTTGRNGLITTTFNACSGINDQVIVDISPDTSLLYDNDPLNNGQPKYTVTCSDKNASELSGIGKTGHIINNKVNEDKTSKIDW